jgi:FkbM family methyltransferase
LKLLNARTVLELLARGRSLKRRLPPRFAPTALYVSPDAQLKYLRPGDEAFDADLLRVVDAHVTEDSIVWDIGANVGVFAFAAASIARKGSTLAVEADLWLAQLMRRSLRLESNQGLQLAVLPSAISDRNGVATFMIAQRGRASNALESAGGRSQMGGIRERLTVPTITLDTLLNFFGAPTFVKIDVEGAEEMVLRGAERLLREVRPTIYIEVGKEQCDAVTALLIANGYLLFDGPSSGAAAATPLQSCVDNTLAVPVH